MGSTATVDVGFGFTVRRCGCVLASAISPKLMPRLHGLLTASGTNDITGSVLVPRTGFVGVHGQDTFTPEAFTFSGAGAVEVVDATVEGGTRIAGATLGFGGDLTIAANNDSGMDAIWIGW